MGLAPGRRGANRTGRPFTGDAAGGYLFRMLVRFDLASGTYSDDGLDDIRLHDTRISNVVRCLPPDNKPVAAEINACRPFLAAECLFAHAIATHFRVARCLFGAQSERVTIRYGGENQGVEAY